LTENCKQNFLGRGKCFLSGGSFRNSKGSGKIGNYGGEEGITILEFGQHGGGRLKC